MDRARHARKDVEKAIDQVNAEHSTDNWKPVHYKNESFSQAALARLYRAADVGVVTPLAEGMNLVAKEYVAAQDPDDPGVLVCRSLPVRLKVSMRMKHCS